MISSAKEYIDLFICEINDEIQWKYVKSCSELKKQIGDIVFHINFYSSKYNNLNTQIEIRSDCSVCCRAYDKIPGVDPYILGYPLLEDHEYWWDITNDNREKIKSEIVSEIKTKIIPLAEALEADFSSGLQALASSGEYQRYWNSLMFFDEYLGRDEAIEIAQTYVAQFTDADRHLTRQYLKGENALINEHNLKYLIDNNLVDIKGLVEKRGFFSKLFGDKN